MGGDWLQYVPVSRDQLLDKAVGRGADCCLSCGSSHSARRQHRERWRQRSPRNGKTWRRCGRGTRCGFFWTCTGISGGGEGGGGGRSEPDTMGARRGLGEEGPMLHLRDLQCHNLGLRCAGRWLASVEEGMDEMRAGGQWGGGRSEPMRAAVAECL